jgi:hypothetical protein
MSAFTVFWEEAIRVELLRVREILRIPVSAMWYKYNICTSWENVVICRREHKTE